MFRAVRVPYGMGRTTVYLPDELDQRLAQGKDFGGVRHCGLINTSPSAESRALFRAF